MGARNRNWLLVVSAWCFIAILTWIMLRLPSLSPVDLLSSTVLVVGKFDSYGSGFAIEPNLIVTAGHCVGMDVSHVEALDGTWHPVVQSWRDDLYDVGFLRVLGSFTPVSVGLTLDVLDEVFLLSCIHGKEYDNSITVGRISYIGRDVHVWTGSLQIDIVGGPGSSGGLLIDSRLRMVGMCVGGDSSVPGVVFFEPVSHILEAYEEYKDATCKVDEGCQEEVSDR